MSAGRSPDFASPKASDLVFAALIGGLAGAALGARSNRVGAASSTIGGASLLVAAKAVARARRRGIENQALWYRILSTGALVAPLGWLAGKTTSAGPTQIGIGTGLLAGVLGVRPQKVVLGPLVGAAVGRGIGGARTQAIAGRGSDGHAGALPDVVGGGVPRHPGDTASRSRQHRRSTVRRTAGSAVRLCGCRLCAVASGGAWWHLRSRRWRRRHRRVA